jgi:cell wall-associated NlpC family hydrolase
LKSNQEPKDLISESLGRLQISHSFFLTVLAILFLATSCATHADPQTRRSLEVKILQQTERSPDAPEIEERIYEEYIRWKGTRHRLGGTGQGGIDCSAFVRAVYQNAFNIELPRTTEEQVKRGRRIKREDLRAGDLVFFKPPSYPRHVGIFLRGRDFVHASKGEGVIISQIAPDYWGKYYWTARRIFP